MIDNEKTTYLLFDRHERTYLGRLELKSKAFKNLFDEIEDYIELVEEDI